MKSNKCCCLMGAMLMVILYMKYEREINNCMRRMYYKINI